jgi:hypothetical protein
VNFSNENSVNFDATPLGAFDDEESDAVEGGGGEGDEVEEIEEGCLIPLNQPNARDL